MVGGDKDLYRFYFWSKGQVKFFCFVLIPHFRVSNMAAIYILRVPNMAYVCVYIVDVGFSGMHLQPFFFWRGVIP